MEDVNSGGRHELEAVGGEGDLRERIKAEGGITASGALLCLTIVRRLQTPGGERGLRSKTGSSGARRGAGVQPPLYPWGRRYATGAPRETTFA